jgi:hypothetical protein
MDIETQRKNLLTYTNWMILPNSELMLLSWIEKLKICQITSKKAIKKWPHWYYVPIGYIERCLNFVSNFDRWLKVQREWIECNEVTTKKGKTKVYDAWVIADFYIVLDGKRIERSCYGTRQMYQNPSISNFVVLEAARSIATKSFADTLWIASDRISKEQDELREKRESEVIESENIDDLTTNFTPWVTQNPPKTT